jgi:hypothetical protein
MVFIVAIRKYVSVGTADVSRNSEMMNVAIRNASTRSKNRDFFAIRDS